jgi:hypothetical protein
MDMNYERLPADMLWGVDVAVKKLRPNVTSFQLENITFTEWVDPTGSEPPLWAEICTQVDMDRHAAEEWLRNN